MKKIKQINESWRKSCRKQIEFELAKQKQEILGKIKVVEKRKKFAKTYHAQCCRLEREETLTEIENIIKNT